MSKKSRKEKVRTDAEEASASGMMVSPSQYADFKFLNQVLAEKFGKPFFSLIVWATPGLHQRKPDLGIAYQVEHAILDPIALVRLF